MELTPEKDSKGLRVANVLAYLALALVGLAICLFAYWALADADVLEVKNSPVPVRTIREHPEADGVVILKVDYCKKVSAVGRVRTSFVGASREVFLPVVEDKQPVQCNGGGKEPVEIPVLIPKDLPVGHYHIHYRVTYNINPIKKGVVVEFDSQDFELVASNGTNKSIMGSPVQ